jgi:hypothetical protein
MVPNVGRMRMKFFHATRYRVATNSIGDVLDMSLCEEFWRAV